MRTMTKTGHHSLRQQLSVHPQLCLPLKGIQCFLLVSLCVRDHILKVCEHDILQTTCGNFTKVTTCMQLGNR